MPVYYIDRKLKFTNIKFHYPFSKIYSLSFRLFFVCLIVLNKNEYVAKTKLWHIIPTLQLTIKQYNIKRFAHLISLDLFLFLSTAFDNILQHGQS